MAFIKELRKVSGGKPVGIKLCVGRPWECFAIANAMLETGTCPDFIAIDGSEGGAGAAPVEFAYHIGAALRAGLILLHKALLGLELRSKVTIVASGKLVSAFTMHIKRPQGT